MALMKQKPLYYCEAQREDQKIEFVHEILRTFQMKRFNPPHPQDFYELIFFNHGARDIQIGNTIHTCGPGDILILTPEETHVGRSCDCLLDRYVIHFGLHALDICGDAGRELLAIFTDRPPYTGNRIRLEGEEADRLQALLSDTDRILKWKTGSVCDVEAVANIIKVLALLRRAQRGSPTETEPNRLLLDIMTYMETNYGTVASLEEICREFGVSRCGMWRMFKQHMHVSPAEYLRSLRLIRARYSLEMGATVTETSMACGFTDASHFIRLFREAYGTTPHQYQKNFQNTERGK